MMISLGSVIWNVIYAYVVTAATETNASLWLWCAFAYLILGGVFIALPFMNKMQRMVTCIATVPLVCLALWLEFWVFGFYVISIPFACCLLTGLVMPWTIPSDERS